MESSSYEKLKVVKNFSPDKSGNPESLKRQMMRTMHLLVSRCKIPLTIPIRLNFLKCLMTDLALLLMTNVLLFNNIIHIYWGACCNGTTTYQSHLSHVTSFPLVPL